MNGRIGPKNQPSILTSDHHRTGRSAQRVASQRVLSLWICTAFVATSLVGCAPASQGRGVSLYSAPLQIEASTGLSSRVLLEVAVVPFAAPVGRDISVETVHALTPELISALHSYTSLQIANSDRPDQAVQALVSTSRMAVSPRERALAFAKAVGSDAVLVPELGRFQDSDGGRFGARNPSAVSFSLELIDTKSGETLWQAGFDRKDVPLSENILRIGEVARTGVQFRTARELVRLGFEEATRDLEGRRAK